MTEIAVNVKELSKEFQIPVKSPGVWAALFSIFKREYKVVQAVKKISFQIQQGELVGFLGPNGAGKTTTLKILAGLLYPTAGSVEVLGFVPWKREEKFQKQFSMVMGQRTQLWWDLAPRETFRLNQKIYEIPNAEFKRTEEELIALLELEGVVDVPVKKLSLGERMKAELACSLLHRPQVLFLDEPTLGLDVVMQKKLRQFIRSYNQHSGATILLTSHNMDDVEELCPRVLILHSGELLYDGALTRIVEEFAPEKLVSLSSSQRLEKNFLEECGRIVSLDGTSAKLEIPRKSVAEVCQKLLSKISVVDFAVEELSIEEIIRRVFLKGPAPKTFHLRPARLENGEEGEWEGEDKTKISSERNLP